MHRHPEEAVGRGCDATPTPSRSQPGGDASATAQHEATCGQPGSAPCVYACARAGARAGECSPRQGACARPRPRERHLSWPAHDHADHCRSDTHTHLIDHAPRARKGWQENAATGRDGIPPKPASRGLKGGRRSARSAPPTRRARRSRQKKSVKFSFTSLHLVKRSTPEKKGRGPQKKKSATFPPPPLYHPTPCCSKALCTV